MNIMYMCIIFYLCREFLIWHLLLCLTRLCSLIESCCYGLCYWFYYVGWCGCKSEEWMLLDVYKWFVSNWFVLISNICISSAIHMIVSKQNKNPRYKPGIGDQYQIQTNHNIDVCYSSPVSFYVPLFKILDLTRDFKFSKSLLNIDYSPNFQANSDYVSKFIISFLQ